MRNFTFCKSGFSRLIFFILFATLPTFSFAQVCGTPGVDGPVAVSTSVNTYYPIAGNITLNTGAQSILLAGVPATDQYSNNFGTTAISAGDLILIIQMQDATINYTNSNSYGSGTTNSGPDNLGGTGFTSLGNSGVFEYVIATNNVPLTGGNLTFKGAGTNGGILNTFYNSDATATRGKRTFQVVRVPQYSNLTLTANITTPPFNGVAGGVIAFNVSGTFNFAGYTIDGSARGFRGGYSPRADSGVNNSTTYVGLYTDNKISGKGEGIAGTPKYMWDGFNQVVNATEGLPAGSSGRGAAANAGGGGNDHNTGGGGGGNGGFGGLGGAGWQGGGGDLYPALTGGGRPGSKSYVTTTAFPRLIMGGGGGAGDANNASSGVKGGVGGAIILINAGNVLGKGTIYANGGKGAPGAYSGSPDGAGGGGAGGTVLLNVSNNSTADIKIDANGGDGGNTENDDNNEHGPGGGGGGGIICHNVSSTVTITTSVLGGAAGKSNAGKGNNHEAVAGTVGYVSTFKVNDIPPNLQVNANCFPVLETNVKTLSTTAICNAIDEKVSYEIYIRNTGAGNAAGVMLDFSFPTGIEFDSATATYSIGATGPAGTLANSATATANNPVFGGFNIAQNGIVTITLVGKVATSMAAGTYSANAQALYLDPTRTTANSTRRITAFTNAYGSANKTYEGTGQSNVPGVNFDGTATTVDDISILALPAAPTVSVTQATCTAPTGVITVNTPANGSGISYTLKGTNPVSAAINNTNGIFSGLVPGTYSVTTTNAEGCTSAPNTGIVINAVAGAPTTTGVTICQGESGSLTASSPCATSSSVGPLFGTVSNVSGTGSGSLDWSNPTGANSIGSGIASASSSSNTTTKYLMATDFKFSIPANAKIKGIEVVIGRYANRNSNNNNVLDNVVRLIKANSIVGENKKSAEVWSTSSTAIFNYGGGTDLWTTAWTPEDINNLGFGIALSANISKSNSNTVTASVDYIQITVSYTIGEIEWYTTSTGGSSIYTGTSFNPVGVTGSGLTSTATATTKTYYAACSGNSNCRAAVNFVVNAKPTITTITSNSRCGAGEVTLEATASAGTINWYAAATGGTSLGTGESFTTPSLSASTFYYVDATENGCTTPTRTEVKATINTVPTINSTTEGSICGSGSVRLTATASTGVTINWYADPTSSTVLGTGTTFNTPALTATTTYYVGAVASSGCTSTSRIAVAAVINTASSIAFTSGTQNPTVCSGASVPNAVYTFGGSATNATVSNLPTGLSAAVDTNAKTVTISGNPTAGGTYTITTVGHTAPCTEKTIQGTVSLSPNVTIAPFSAATSTRCQGAETITKTTTASNSTGITYNLDSASSAGGNTINSTTGAVTYVAGWSGTTTITASAAGCNGPVTTTHTVTTNALPTATISGNLTACSTTTLTANSNASSPTYVWYKNNVAIPSQISSTLVVNSDGDYKVKVRNSSGCESTSEASTVKVSDSEKPVKPVLADITGECTATATAPTTTDNCAGTVTGTTADPLTYNAQGSYTINWSFSDGNGNVETATQKVIVKDTQKPVKPVLADITGECSATATAPATTDNCEGTVTGTTADPLTYNAQGTYTINWSFNDGNGNVETATQKVIIKDTQKPVKPVLADITAECSATVTAPTTTDNCEGTVTGTTADPLTYNAQGTYTINWSFSDGNGNVETATQKVIVKDTEKPVKPVLADITGECSATATAPTTTDNCEGTVTGTTSDSLTYNAQGTYTINWSFSDGNGNVETATQKVIIKDTQKPVKPVLADITAECSATATAPTTTDNCAGTVTGTTADPLTYNAQGTYTINWSFSDGNGNVETATQKVIVKDTEKPVKPVLADITGECSATATAPTTTDNCEGTVTGTTADPLTYNAQGTYTINWSFSDGNGNVETATQKVIIKDTQKPVKPVLADITGECSATATAPTTTDNCEGTVTGTTADPLTYNTQGTYTINWSFSDGNGNVETATQKVIIKDTQKPVKPVLADITGECAGTATAPTTTDNCAGTVTGTTADPLTYNTQGTYTINWSFSDGNGNVETATQKVVIKDTQKPSITCPLAVSVSADANSCTATGVALGSPVVSDNCSGTITVTNDAPSSFPVGNTTVTWTATDAGGNTETCTQIVKVIVEIRANDDSVSSSNGVAGGVVITNVFDNDALNCNKVNRGDVDVTVNGSVPSVLIFNTANGAVSVKPNTPTGTYTFDYSICEIANSGNCNTATVKVEIVNDLVAVKDDFGTKSSGLAAVIIGNVKTNDTLDGVYVTSGNTVVTIDSDGPLSVDANGDVTLATNTPSGTYSITYEICEKDANPSNCKTAIAEVKVVNRIDAVLDIITPINGNIGGTTVSLIGNDTLNGNKAIIGINSGEVTINIVGTLPSGLTLNANGTITVASGTPKGDYEVEYTICEVGAVPANCDSVTITVPVTAGNLVANEDVIPSVLGSNVSQTLGKNVFDNDTKNAQPLNPSDVTLKTTTADPKGYLTVDANGNIVLGANPPAGDYELTYEICEKLNPDNCSSNTVKVTVGTPVIDAVEDIIASINGNIGGTTIALTANDKLNGNAIVVGTAAGEVKFEIVGTLLSGLTLNSDYTISVAPNTPKGDYKVEYKICENTNPLNCDSVTITVPVTAGNLVANEDVIPSVLGSNVSQTLGKNVFDNDTKNAQPLNPSDVTLKTTTADPKGYLTVDANGNIVLGANPPAGDYELTYEICEKLNPDNCSSNTVKVTVGTPIIDAVEDLITPINGNIGGTTISLIANDKLNGSPVAVGTAAGEVKFEIVGTLPSGLTLNSDYTISVAPNTPKGNYKVEYKICENTNPLNCDSVTITVPVTAGNLVANEDIIPSVLGSNVSQTLGKNVFDNDTKNAQPLNPSDVTLKTTAADPKGYLTVDADGNIVLGANPPAGDYELTYEICEKLNPDNCSSNTVKVTVGTPVIDAVEDIIASINGNIGGTTIALTANDKLNGNAIVVGTAAGEVKFEIIGTLPAGLTLNSDYTITVAPNTPKGNYNVEYKICENTNPLNCDSVITTVPVTAGNLVANEDVIPSVLGSNVSQTLGKNVFDNDTKNAQPLNPSDVTLKTTAADPKGYLTVDADGNIVLGANPPAGDYELTYEICEKLNPDNCSSNTVKVTVGTPVIDAVEDIIVSINGNIGGKTISLIANDKLNGSPIVVGTAAGEVKFEIVGTLPSGLTLNSDYTITVAPNTPAADYKVEYKICENTNPTNCDSVITVVKVTGGNLVANEDLVPSAVGVNVPQKVINVFENDTKDGNKLVPSDVDLKVTQADPKGYLTVDIDGNVVLAPNAPAGEYELTYTICEKLNPNNCDSNVVKVTVTEPKMTVKANSYCSNNVPYVNYTVTPDNFTTNNLLTVRWIDSNNSVVATQTNLPLSGNILWPGAEIDSNQNGTDWPGWILNNGIWAEGADGFEATRNGVKMEFSLNPTVTVSVAYPPATPDCNARPTFSIKANNDEAGPINVKKGVDATINIFENDLLNGVKLKPSDVVLSVPVEHPNITLNADGSINIAANTADGVYELTYQICEAANTSNCSQAVIKITVDNVVDPAPPTENQITLNNDNDVSADGINGSLEFVNVLENDLINGQTINPADVIIKPVTESPYFEWNADGTVNVKPNTPGGNYPLTYQVCEKANSSNCSTATLNVFVEVPAISVVKTAVFNDENKSGFANAGETITYKFTVTNTGNVPLVGITINDPLPGVVVSGQAINLGVNESNETNFVAVYKITQEDINRGSVSNQATVKGSSVRGVVVEDQSDDASNSGDSPTVLDLNGCSIKVMNAFSPNGDNKNARFYIRGIECYPDNTVEIYNRWGVLVFSIDQYNNNDRVFVGYSNGRSTIKQTDGLPVGTYFYILKYKDSAQKSHQESGYLYLNK
ncbi:gliding motility-associated C-terminal domain-containing protein [Flavobacterium sp. LHD-85]|uniref:Ig-like domain-containing protein n=1 Tax=Flavobacterium sp. LHD-85 TaxID=3071410 RepID=UPI0027DF9CE3|nr:gliding motility-associated C-terminal domain-containing protein [Flavobacterium sp. LHD-85]MDQ6527943.1 gliding motility-associated C-terminal domain-containing protein [Flavobacterium sp. LHD-85]